MKQIKNEYVHRERISSFLYGDINGIKQQMDISIRSENGLTGYIRDIYQKPFGFQLFSAKQVIFFYIACIIFTEISSN